MELLVCRRKYHTVLPVHSSEIRVTVIPEKRIPVSSDTHDMEPRAMPVTFFVGANGHFRNMRMHDSVGEHEHDISTARSTIAPRAELDFGEIRDKVCLPHMISLTNLMEITITREIAIFARPTRKVIWMVKNEGLIIE
jgi:hypothetical protein